MLTELEDRLSTVPRWGIVRTIQKQTVMEHCGRVAIIANRIAIKWFGILDAITLYETINFALHHDDVEAVSGDVPSIVKDLVNEEGMKARYCKELRPIPVSDMARKIVRIADKMEALIFINTEMALGNDTLRLIRRDITNNLLVAGHEAGVGVEVQNWLQEPLRTEVDPMDRRG